MAMASWKVAPCLDQLLYEINTIAPGRDTTSDGSIGDEAHQGTGSDHNPDENGIVCARDFDDDLRAAFTMEDVVQYLLGEFRKPNDVGLDRGRCNYMIYNRRWWRADTGWKQETYTGSSAHTEHMHLSCEHDAQFVNDTRPWGLIERFGDMALSDTDIDKIAKAVQARLYNPQPLNGPDGQPDGTTTTVGGHYSQIQGIPETPGGPRVPAYELLGQINEGVRDIQQRIAELPSS